MNRKIISGTVISIETFVNKDNKQKTDVDKLGYLITLNDNSQHIINNSLGDTKVGDNINIIRYVVESSKNKEERLINTIVNKKSAKGYLSEQRLSYALLASCFIINIVAVNHGSLGYLDICTNAFLCLTFVFLIKRVKKDALNKNDVKILKNYLKNNNDINISDIEDNKASLLKQNVY